MDGLSPWTRELPTRLFGPGGWVDVAHPASADPASGRFTFTWSGADARGRFRGQGRPGVIAPLDPPAGASQLFAVHVARGFVLLQRCRDGDCELWAQPQRLPPVRVGSLKAMLADPDGRPATLGSLPLADGGVAVRIGTTDAPSEADAVLRFDARGRLVRQRGFTWTVPVPRRALAVTPEGPGLGLLVPWSSYEVRFFGMDPRQPPRALGVIEPGVPQACASDEGPSFLAPGDEYRQQLSLRWQSGEAVVFVRPFMRTVLGFGADRRPCARGFQTPFESGFGADMLRADIARFGGVPSLRAVGGAIELAVRGPTTDRTATCQIEQQ